MEWIQTYLMYAFVWWWWWGWYSFIIARRRELLKIKITLRNLIRRKRWWWLEVEEGHFKFFSWSLGGSSLWVHMMDSSSVLWEIIIRYQMNLIHDRSCLFVVVKNLTCSKSWRTRFQWTLKIQIHMNESKRKTTAAIQVKDLNFIFLRVLPPLLKGRGEGHGNYFERLKKKQSLKLIS